MRQAVKVTAIVVQFCLFSASMGQGWDRLHENWWEGEKWLMVLILYPPSGRALMISFPFFYMALGKLAMFWLVWFPSFGRVIVCFSIYIARSRDSCGYPYFSRRVLTSNHLSVCPFFNRSSCAIEFWDKIFSFLVKIKICCIQFTVNDRDQV